MKGSFGPLGEGGCGHMFREDSRRHTKVALSPVSADLHRLGAVVPR